jgi:dimethylglycine catabolism A
VRATSGGETLLFVQLIDFLRIRRRPEPARFFTEFLVLRPEHRAALCDLTGEDRWRHVPAPEVRARLAALSDAELEFTLTERELEALRHGARERVTDTHLPHVRDLPRVLPERFAAAAHRAERAGFDGVELHYAHAYTMASFLSALNTRDDGYGGPREQRVRLPLEVFRAVRAGVAPDFVVGCRFLGDEVVAGGSSLDEAVYFGVEFAQAGMDFLSVSKGGKFEDAAQPRVGEAAYPYTGPSGHECMPTVRIDSRGPFGRNLYLARAVRGAVRAAGFDTPVVAAGGINSFRLAEEALTRGDADIIAAARQTLADPDWFLKVYLGRGDEVRRCKFTNYCEALDQLHKQVTCQLWDKIRPSDPDAATAPHASDGKRRLVPPGWKP